MAPSKRPAAAAPATPLPAKRRAAVGPATPATAPATPAPAKRAPSAPATPAPATRTPATRCAGTPAFGARTPDPHADLWDNSIGDAADDMACVEAEARARRSEIKLAEVTARTEEAARIRGRFEELLKESENDLRTAEQAAEGFKKRWDAAEARFKGLETRAEAAEEKLLGASAAAAEASGRVAVLEKLVGEAPEAQQRILAAEQRASRAEAQAEVTKGVFEKMHKMMAEMISMQRGGSRIIDPRMTWVNSVPIKLEDVDPTMDTACVTPTGNTSKLQSPGFGAATPTNSTFLPALQATFKRAVGYDSARVANQR